MNGSRDGSGSYQVATGESNSPNILRAVLTRRQHCLADDPSNSRIEVSSPFVLRSRFMAVSGEEGKW